MSGSDGHRGLRRQLGLVTGWCVGSIVILALLTLPRVFESARAIVALLGFLATAVPYGAVLLMVWRRRGVHLALAAAIGVAAPTLLVAAWVALNLAALMGTAALADWPGALAFAMMPVQIALAHAAFSAIGELDQQDRNPRWGVAALLPLTYMIVLIVIAVIGQR